MKKLIYTLFAVTIMFSACEKEEEDENAINNSVIIGDWISQEITSVEEQGYYNGGYPNGERLVTNVEDWGGYNNNISVSFSGNNWNDSDGGFGSYSINGSTLELNFQGGYDFDNNEVLELDITSLTSSELIMEASNEDTMTHYWDPNNDTVYFYRTDTRYEFEKSSSILNNSISKIAPTNKYSFLKTFVYRKKKITKAYLEFNQSWENLTNQ